jgi:hypothetical protein
MTPHHKLPTNSAGPLTLKRHGNTAAVTGPTSLENGRGPLTTPGRTPPLAGATPKDVHPCGHDCTKP